MAGCHRKISSFLVFASIVLVIDGSNSRNWILKSNWTSEMQCPQIVEINCDGNNLKGSSWQWIADDDVFADYTYNDNDTDFPIKANSSIEGLEVTILNISKKHHKIFFYSYDTYTINSTLIADSDIIQKYKDIECDDGNVKGSIKVDFNCVDVHLQVNDTIEGEICPAGLNFSSIAMNVKSIVWYLGENKLINYIVNSDLKWPLDLCTQKNNNGNLTDLCDNGGSLTINNKVTLSDSRYDVVSTLILTGTYIFDRQYLYVESGSNNITKIVPSNFILVCGTEDLKISSNITDDDSDSCDDVIVEFVCVGTDVPNFFWVFNNETSMLSPNYTYSQSSLFPVIVNATILDVNVLISADTNNCSDKHFNFNSTLTVSASSLIRMRIMSIGCVTHSQQRWTAVNCTATSHWWHKLSFLDKFPFCHVAESKSLSECAECFGIVLAILTVIIIIIFSCVCCCCCCCKCIQVPRHMEEYLIDNKSTDTEKGEFRSFPMWNCAAAPCDYGPVNYSGTVPRRRITLASLGKAKYKHWRSKKRYHRIRTTSEARIFAAEVEEFGALLLAKEFFSEIYTFVEELPDIGSRLQKYWYLREKDETCVIQFLAKKSAKCPVSFENSYDSEFHALKYIFLDIKHPHLLDIHDVDAKYEYISIIQEFMSEGSLRDKMFKATPTNDWSEKYTSSGRVEPFSSKEIAVCGRHVLEAVLALYEIGFPQIGQIHCGNVFIKEDKFVLGGYENTLLGYRTSLYKEISQAELLSSIDVIMFGQMIYEMATGRRLDKVLLDGYAFEEVTDESVKEVLQFIFKPKMRTEKKPMKKIRCHKFFSDVSVESQSEMADISISDDGKRLLKSVADFQKGETQKTFTRDDLFDFAEATSKLHMEYTEVQVCPRIGFRIGKTYAKARSAELDVNGLLSAMLIPDTCSIVVKDNIRVIRKLLQLKHKYVCQVRDIEHIKLNGQHLVVIFQDFINGGSLKDYIHQVSNPTSAWWETKYCRRGFKMAYQQVARLGNQLLQAINYLSHLDGHSEPFVLGCIHTGNIFLEDNDCKLGGFENSLLGCQARQYRMLENYSSRLDIIMFGHVIYEMCTGRELTTGIPNENDYKEVPRHFERILKHIFDETTTDIIMIIDHSFFTEHSHSNFSEDVSETVDENMKHLLQQVRNKKSVDQDESMKKKVFGALKSGVQHVRKLLPGKQ